MADYLKAIPSILASEGYRKGKSIGWVNDGADRGKETVAGISRYFWPNSKVWPIIDAAKLKPNFPASLANNEELYQLIIDFYKVNFWDPCHAGKIRNQVTAKTIVDTAVLEGLKPAIKRIEEIFGMKQKGIMTPEIVKTLNLLL